MKTFKHTGEVGDCIYFLPIMRHLGGGILNLCHKPGVTREDITKPRTVAALRPLLEAQPYVKEVRVCDWSEPADYDPTYFRRVMAPTRNLTEAQRITVCPFKVIDESIPWLFVGDFEKHDLPVISRGPRYRNPEWDRIWPKVLRAYPNAVYVGFPGEHEAFQRQFKCRVDFHPTKDLLELAKFIAGSSIYIGSQSSPLAIAEGLKVRRVVERAPIHMNHVIYHGNGAAHILHEKDWNIDDAAHMGVALQYWEGDGRAAIELAELIARLIPERRDDITFILCPRHDCPSSFTEAIQAILEPLFPILVLKSSRRGTGWPGGCNDLWQSTMMQLSKLKDENRLKAEMVFTIEPDCCPLTPNFLDLLRMEWIRGRDSGKPVCGMLIEPNTHRSHINGNAMFATQIIKHHLNLQISSGPWDMTHRLWLMANARITARMAHHYRSDRAYTQDDAKNLIAEGCVLVHGVRNHTLRSAVADYHASIQEQHETHQDQTFSQGTAPQETTYPTWEEDSQKAARKGRELQEPGAAERGELRGELRPRALMP